MKSTPSGICHPIEPNEEEKYNIECFGRVIEALEKDVFHKTVILMSSVDQFKREIDVCMRALKTNDEVDLSGISSMKETFLGLIGEGSLSSILSKDFSELFTMYKALGELKACNDGRGSISLTQPKSRDISITVSERECVSPVYTMACMSNGTKVTHHFNSPWTLCDHLRIILR